MKKILFMVLIAFGLIFSSDAFARFGRVGGFRSSGFRSHSYSRSYHSPRSNSIKSHSATPKSKAIANKTKSSNTQVNKPSKTVNKTHTNTIIKETDSGMFNNAPLWFLVGHSVAQDRVTVINNTNEKFSCSDCESIKDEKDVYNACMKKCIK